MAAKPERPDLARSFGAAFLILWVLAFGSIVAWFFVPA
jgi:hypothetical protein